MKFGILTFHNIPNYGAAFQALALCQALRNMGADCEIINYQCENIIARELTFHKGNNPLKNVAKYFLTWTPRKKRIENFNVFMKQMHMVSSKTYDKNCVSESNVEYDVFISGSDMVWDLGITAHDFTYFLDFVKENRYRFAYASSSGKDWGKDSAKVVSLLKKYQRIAVRESDVQKIIQQYNLNCQLVADPTMLMQLEYWKSLAEKQKNPEVNQEGYVLVYFPYKEILSAAKKYAEENHLKLLVIKDFKEPLCGYDILKIYHPLSWLNAFRNAEIIFTDSYHGVLFSMYFNKDFWTNHRCNRIESILNIVGLSDRFIDCGVSKKKINYMEVNQKLEKFRNESLSYLSNMVCMAQEEKDNGSS